MKYLSDQILLYITPKPQNPMCFKCEWVVTQFITSSDNVVYSKPSTFCRIRYHYETRPSAAHLCPPAPLWQGSWFWGASTSDELYLDRQAYQEARHDSHRVGQGSTWCLNARVPRESDLSFKILAASHWVPCLLLHPIRVRPPIISRTRSDVSQNVRRG